jgi:hypothetical protein
MKTPCQRTTISLMLLAMWPCAAYAQRGMYTLFVGAPLMGALALAMFILLMFSSSRTLKIIASILFIPSLITALFIAPDAWSLLSFDEPSHENNLISYSFFGAGAFAGLLYYLLMYRPVVSNNSKDDRAN